MRFGFGRVFVATVLTDAGKAEKGVVRMKAFSSRFFSGGRKNAQWLPGLGALFFAACLPDPDIRVPDLRPSGPVDLGAADLARPKDGGGPRFAPNDPAVPTAQTLRAIVVEDGGQFFVAGQGGVLFRFDGTAWKQETAFDGTNPIKTNFYGLTKSGTDLYAVGEAGVIVKRTGDKWEREGQALGVTSSLYATVATGGGEVYAAGDAGTMLRKTAGSWSVDTTSPALAFSEFRAMAKGPADELFAVGVGGMLARRSGSSWDVDSVPLDATDRTDFYAVVITQEAVFAAGHFNRVVRRDADKWRRESNPTNVPAASHLYGLCSSQTDLFAVGTGGVIERRDTQTKNWALEDSGTSVLLSAVACSVPVRTVGALGSVLVRK